MTYNEKVAFIEKCTEFIRMNREDERKWILKQITGEPKYPGDVVMGFGIALFTEKRLNKVN